MDTAITRTLGSGAATTKWTLAFWCKKAASGSYQRFFTCNGTGDVYFRFSNTETMQLSTGGSDEGVLNTNRFFRDPGAWFHIVIRYDSTEVSANDRFRLYINGVDERDVGGYSSETMPGSSQTDNINLSGNVHRIGGVTGQYFGGEMSHIHLCIGYSYAPTEFGEVDSTSGIWKIKTSPSVSYGTNGFFLKMEDRTNLDLDSSPNANTFATAGTLTATYDNPSNNFATINPLNYGTASGITLTNGNLTTTTGGPDTTWYSGYGTLGFIGTGKFYYEMKVNVLAGGSYTAMGIVDSDQMATSDGYFTTKSRGYGYNQAGEKGNNNSDAAYGDAFTTGDVISMAYNNGTIWFGKNGTWQNSATDGEIAAGTTTNAAYTGIDTTKFFLPAVQMYSGTTTDNFNFGNGYFGTTAITSAGTNASNIGSFEYDVPAGLTAISTKGFNE